ncbi:MAG: helix-turn-helix domain-containing protein [Candidatus Krumholzibacteriia bacterium]
MATRNYTQRKRAQQQELTRQRIVAATVELHEELGAARTTVSAVAKRAGVQRLTVYRHFPDDAALLEACTTRWLELNPLPTAADWQDVADPLARAVAALGAFHAYYRRTARMWHSSYRDRDTVPALAERLALVERYLDGIADELTAPLQLTARGHRLAGVVVRHGLRFTTWQSLAELGLAEQEMGELVGDWLGGVVGEEIVG